MGLLGERANLLRRNTMASSVLRRLEISGAALQRPSHQSPKWEVALSAGRASPSERCALVDRKRRFDTLKH